MITACITTCRRLNLFIRTMDSLLSRCQDIDKAHRWIVVDDGSTDSDLDIMKRLYPFLEIHRNPAAGHCNAVNFAFSLIDTEYVFWCEDDWLFTRPFKLSDATDVMLATTQIKEFSWRHWDCPKKKSAGIPYRLHRYTGRKGNIKTQDFHWPGFTLNPSIIKVEAVKECMPFTMPEFEYNFGRKWMAKRYRIAHVDVPTIEHIGAECSAYTLTGRKKGKTMILQHYVNLWWIGGLEHNILSMIKATPDWTHRISVRADINPVAAKMLQPYGIKLQRHTDCNPRNADAVILHNQHRVPKLHCPTVSIYHGFPAADKKQYYYPWALNCSVNLQGTAELNELFGQEAPCLYPGIETPRVRKTEYSLKGKPVIGMITAPRHEKLSKALFQVFTELHKEQDFTLRIMGLAGFSGRFKSAPFNVELLPCSIDAREKQEFLTGLDIGFYTATCTEGFGIAVQEMLAAGLPVAADGAGGILNQITDGENGLLFTDVSGAVTALKRLISSEALRQKFGEAAKERIDSLYSLAGFKARFEKAIKLATALRL